jgi:hypothetical protein
MCRIEASSKEQELPTHATHLSGYQLFSAESRARAPEKVSLVELAKRCALTLALSTHATNNHATMQPFPTCTHNSKHQSQP